MEDNRNFKGDLTTIRGHFEKMFYAWFDIVSGHDPQHYQDLDWDWEVEIQKFIDDPEDQLKYQVALQQNDDEELNADREEDERGEFINCFGEKMGKRKQ